MPSAAKPLKGDESLVMPSLDLVDLELGGAEREEWQRRAGRDLSGFDDRRLRDAAGQQQRSQHGAQVGHGPFELGSHGSLPWIGYVSWV